MKILETPAKETGKCTAARVERRRKALKILKIVGLPSRMRICSRWKQGSWCGEHSKCFSISDGRTFVMKIDGSKITSFPSFATL